MYRRTGDASAIEPTEPPSLSDRKHASPAQDPPQPKAKGIRGRNTAMTVRDRPRLRRRSTDKEEVPGSSPGSPIGPEGARIRRFATAQRSTPRISSRCPRVPAKSEVTSARERRRSNSHAAVSCSHVHRCSTWLGGGSVRRYCFCSVLLAKLLPNKTALNTGPCLVRVLRVSREKHQRSSWRGVGYPPSWA
jgi:hypothetical protein